MNYFKRYVSWEERIKFGISFSWLSSPPSRVAYIFRIHVEWKHFTSLISQYCEKFFKYFSMRGFSFLARRNFGRCFQGYPESLWNPQNIVPLEKKGETFSSRCSIKTADSATIGWRFICTLFSGKCDTVAVESLNGAECNLFAYTRRQREIFLV